MSENVEVDFKDAQQAVSTYYGDSGGGQDGGDDGSGSARWGELQTEPTDWVAGWTLVYQAEVGGDRRRWFVIRTTESGQFQALSMTGRAQDTNIETTSLDELPHTNDEKEARSAYETWVSESYDGDGADDQEGDQWGEWEKDSTADGWHLFTRAHKTEDRRQWFAAGVVEDGSRVYLQPDGSVGEEIHVYDDRSSLQSALDAYGRKAQNGDVPEGRRPTGAAPSRSGVRKDARKATGEKKGGALSGAIGAVGGPRNAVLIGGAGAAGLYYANSAGHIDIAEWFNQ